MANSPSYQEAHQKLQSILQDKLFHTPKQPIPWWMRVLQWITRHIHLNLSVHALRDVGFALAGVCIILILAAGVVVWRVVRGRARGLAIRVPPQSQDGQALLKDANRLFEAGDYAQMLHFLIEAMLLRAATEGLIRVRLSKTLRAYSRELVRAEAPLASVFQSTAAAAESVWFAKHPLAPADAERILREVSDALAVRGTEAS